MVLVQEYVELFQNNNNGKRSVETRSEEINENATKLLEYKWDINFNFLDLNHDKTIDCKDMFIHENVFINIYKLEGYKKASIKQKLRRFWTCVTLNGVFEGLSKEQFIGQILQAYRGNKTHIIRQIRSCMSSIVHILDHDENGLMTFDELSVFYKSVNMRSRELAQIRYGHICPSALKYCTVQNITDNWTFNLIGVDEEAFKTILADFEDAGMALDDLVE